MKRFLTFIWSLCIVLPCLSCNNKQGVMEMRVGHDEIKKSIEEKKDEEIEEVNGYHESNAVTVSLKKNKLYQFVLTMNGGLSNSKLNLNLREA